MLLSLEDTQKKDILKNFEEWLKEQISIKDKDKDLIFFQN